MVSVEYLVTLELVLVGTAKRVRAALPLLEPQKTQHAQLARRCDALADLVRAVRGGYTTPAGGSSVAP